MGSMSWSDDIRCLHCDGRLPLYRKITHGQFCSNAHRKAYWAEQERLAVERLHQTHDSLHAYRPKGPVEAILGTTEPEPEPAPPAIHIVSAPPPPEDRPAWLPQVNAGDIPMASFVKISSPSHPRWMEDRLAGIEPEPLDSLNLLRHPVNAPLAYDRGFNFAGSVQLQIAPAAPAPSSQTALVPMQVILYPVSRLFHDLAPQTRELEAHAEPAEPDPAPLAESLFAIDRPAPVDTALANREPASQITMAMRAQLPLDAVRLNSTLAPASLV